MNKKETFEIIYHVNDGYVGGSRPQCVIVDPRELEDDMDDLDLESFYEDAMTNDFENRIFPEGNNVEEFLEWAKKVLKNRND